jgi:integrase
VNYTRLLLIAYWVYTFATLTLSKGVSIENVSKMLGHTNIQTTQIYARITNEKISNDMALFAGKVKGMEWKQNLK